VKTRPHFVKVKGTNTVPQNKGGKANEVVNEKAYKDFVKGLFNK
jgi:hypothetical protein